MSGTIDRYGNLWGRRPARVLGRTFLRPVLDPACGILTAQRIAQMRSPKIVMPGLARAPVAFLDAEGGWMAGKSTVILYDSRVDLAFLCGLLDSDLYGAIYRALFGGLALSGGYLRIGPPQIARLPLLIPPARTVEAIRRRVLALHEEKRGEAPSPARVRELDTGLQALVWRAAGIDPVPTARPGEPVPSDRGRGGRGSTRRG